MPNIPSGPLTFAFSKRRDAWTTRYSFVPTCYATSGNVMLSSADNKGVWIHDKNNVRNSFYGDLYKSRIETSFNDYSSEVKHFKAISIESNVGGFSASFKTNNEYPDENKQGAILQSSAFQQKEGFRYAELPRSTQNSTSNFVPMPGGAASLESLNNAYETTQAVYAGGGTDSIEFELEFSYPFENHLPIGSEILRSVNGQLVNFTNFCVFPVLINIDGEETNIVIPNMPNLVVSGVTDTGIVVSSDFWNPGDITNLLLNEEVTVSQWAQIIQEFLSPSSNLAVAGPAHISGDNMKGTYVNVEIETTVNTHIEINAINIDYELSRSASRLTQNS